MSYSPEQANVAGGSASAIPPQPGVPPQAGAVPPQAGPVPPAWTGRWAGAPRGKSPALAGILSGFMPGLGQIYLGYYQRGFVHAGVFAGIIGCLASGAARHMEPLFGVMLAFFYLYNIIDSVRRASLYNMALAGLTQMPMPEDFKMPAGRSSLFGGVIVTGIGLLLLLNSRWDFDLDWLADWWPAIIMLIGLGIVWRAVKDRTSH